MKLNTEFYTGEDVTEIARLLLGKNLMVRSENGVSGGMIVETEAYSGAVDRASHAFNFRRTKRTEVMFSRGGVAYVYLCYGIHHLFNVVTNKAGLPDAVLIRALQPFSPGGIGRGQGPMEYCGSTNGPGKLTKAVGIDMRYNTLDLRGNDIWIEDNGNTITLDMVVISKRIGVDYAGEDANLPWRFYVKDNEWVSRK